MRVIVAGSRGIAEVDVLLAISHSPFPITEIVSGGCHGPDKHGEVYARTNGLEVAKFPAEWERYGKSAGSRRNKVMAEYADALIAVWDGKSRGTKDMIKQMLRLGKSVYVSVVKE